MKKRRPCALAVRLYVDEHHLAHYELYERTTKNVLMRRMVISKRGTVAHNSLSVLLDDIAAIG